MRLSTSGFYDRSSAAMGRLSARSDTLYTQLSTGKRLATASDDAVAYQRLRGIAQGSADDGVSTANLKLAAGVLATADTTLGAIGEQFGRASELALQARNGTLSAEQKAAIATELDAIVAALDGLAQTTDPRGQPLFGGSEGAAMTVAGGRRSFNDTAPGAIPIGNGQTVTAGENAARVFVLDASGRNGIDAVADLAAALRSGGGEAAVATAITDLAAAETQASTVRASLGARAARVEVETARLKDVGADREAVRIGLEDTDVAATITELQKTMTVLSATQASFSKLSGLSLFDYLR